MFTNVLLCINLIVGYGFVIPPRFFSGILITNDKYSASSALYLTTADFKNGMTIELEGVPFKLLEFLHVKPGKGSAFVRTKVKNLVSGTTQERTFRAGESVASADINKVEMQYTFNDGNNVVFMNMETFEEQRVSDTVVPNKLLLKEGLSCVVTLWNDQVIDIQLPPQVAYKVVDCPPNFKGNTAQGALKPATLDSGAIVQVPMFIEVGESVLVNTEDCKYMGREGA